MAIGETTGRFTSWSTTGDETMDDSVERNIGAEAESAEFLRSAGIRAVEPGTLYNIGNVLGFVVGLAVALCMETSASADTTLWDRALAHVAGSPAAAALTTATAVFFWGGIVYTKAWSHGPPPVPRLNRWGDVLSGIGAIILGIGLVMLGNPWLAASAGVLHAVGKFGSAASSAVVSRDALVSERAGAFFKDLVLVSRAPAILAGAAALWDELVLQQSMQGSLLALSFMICCMIWATADWMLLSPQGWIRTSTASLFSKESKV